MRIDILTLFPDTMRAMLGESILGRAQARGLLDIRCHQIRDYTENRQKQVDDYPYGGGWGQVMMAQPLKSCLDDIMSTAQGKHSRVIYMSPPRMSFPGRRTISRQTKALRISSRAPCFRGASRSSSRATVLRRRKSRR